MLKFMLRTLLRRTGFDLVRYGSQAAVEERLVFLARERKLATILDVGANVGQFRAKIASLGYEGRVISFEPQHAAHDALVRSARAAKNWTVYPRCALGDAPGVAKINIAGNSQSSSLLAMHARHVEAWPQTRYCGVEEVPVKTLAQVFADDPSLFEGRQILKMDTQGFELNVLKGAETVMDRIDVVMLEASLVTLYDGEPTVAALLNYLDERQFDCYAICPGSSDAKKLQMLQVDILFARQPAAPH